MNLVGLRAVKIDILFERNRQIVICSNVSSNLASNDILFDLKATAEGKIFCEY